MGGIVESCYDNARAFFADRSQLAYAATGLATALLAIAAAGAATNAAAGHGVGWSLTAGGAGLLALVAAVLAVVTVRGENPDVRRRYAVTIAVAAVVTIALYAVLIAVGWLL